MVFDGEKIVLKLRLPGTCVPTGTSLITGMPSKTVVKEYYCKKNTKVDITERVLKGPEERLNFSCKLLYTCTHT